MVFHEILSTFNLQTFNSYIMSITLNAKPFFFLLFLFSFGIFAQVNEPQYYYSTVSKLHGIEDADMEAWKNIEQEFFDKVISKNDRISGHEMLINVDEPGLSEVIIIYTYKNWEDYIEAKKLTEELIEMAWPDEQKRAEFFEEQNKNFGLYYSNEMFRSTGTLKRIDPELRKNRTTPLYFYIVNNKLADYNNQENINAYEDYVNNVTFKNKNVLGYYPFRHFIGSDSRDFMEVYVTDSYESLLESFELDKALLLQLFPDQQNRQDFIDVYNQGVESATGIIYKNIPSLSKF